VTPDRRSELSAADGPSADTAHQTQHLATGSISIVSRAQGLEVRRRMVVPAGGGSPTATVTPWAPHT